MVNSIIFVHSNNIFCLQMETRKKSNKPLRYDSIPLERRMKLVELVLEKKLSIRKSSIQLGINGSTAKLIVKRFRQNKTFFIKRNDQQRYLNPSNVSNTKVVQPDQIINKQTFQSQTKISPNANNHQVGQASIQQYPPFQNGSAMFYYYYLMEQIDFSASNRGLLIWY